MTDEYRSQSAATQSVFPFSIRKISAYIELKPTSVWLGIDFQLNYIAMLVTMVTVTRPGNPKCSTYRKNTLWFLVTRFAVLISHFEENGVYAGKGQYQFSDLYIRCAHSSDIS